MTITIKPHAFCGQYMIPASKSHTIRRLFLALGTEGQTVIVNPLESLDTASCIAVCRGLGAQITEVYSTDDAGGVKKLRALRIQGIKNSPDAASDGAVLDAGNSGTTLFFAIAQAALGGVEKTFTGDAQIARRSAAPLLGALSDFGVEAASNGGCTPITVRGPWKGGKTTLACPTSQFLSALLLAAPLAPAGVVTEIDAPDVNELPYIKMTLAYLAGQSVDVFYNAALTHFVIKGGGVYIPINSPVPADFSSAAFPACAAAVSGGDVMLSGLDRSDTQGDKAFFDMIAQMGASVIWSDAGAGQTVRVTGDGGDAFGLRCALRGAAGNAFEPHYGLHGGAFDLNDTPDLLPVMAVMGSFAQGVTRLYNVAGARIKETDRIAVMSRELRKAGVDIAEQPDGLLIHGGRPLLPCAYDSGNDHRVVMALACASLGSRAIPSHLPTISNAEAADVTYPGFLSMIGGE
jgi:3-phosphoshikimate 1-carboxyvinyltransferase